MRDKITAAAPPAGRWKRLAGRLLLPALMALTLCFLLRGQQLSLVAGALKTVRPPWVLAGMGLMLGFVGCEAMCSKLILTRLGHRPRYLRCLGYSFVGFYVSSITPSATGGQPAQIYYMSRDGIPAAHGTLNMMLIAVCYQVAILAYAGAALLAYPALLAAMGTGLGLLLLYGTAVMLALTVGMLLFMFWPAAAGRLAGGVLALLVRLRLLRDGEGARRKLSRQMEEYRAGAGCIRRNRDLTPKLFGLTVLQLTGLFAVPYTVYRAFGLTGHSVAEMVCAQALLTLAVSMLPLPGAVGATEGGFVRFFTIFFGAGLVTPAVLVSRGVSLYACLAVSACVTLTVHFLTRADRRVKTA